MHKINFIRLNRPFYRFFKTNCVPLCFPITSKTANMFPTDISKNTVSKTKLIYENEHKMRIKIFNLVLFFHGLVAAQTYRSMIDRMMAQIRDRRTKMLISWSKSSTVPRSHFKIVELNHDGNVELCDGIEKRSPNKEFRKIFWDMNPKSMSKV